MTILDWLRLALLTVGTAAVAVGGFLLGAPFGWLALGVALFVAVLILGAGG